MNRQKSSSHRQTNYQPEWIRIDETGFNKAHIYRLIKAGKLRSGLFDPFGSGKGIRLINRRSLEQLIEREIAA
jgi:hypothetical protein